LAYLKIECSVARNKKFLKAGPAPSWLWVCGLAYCQEGLTDGFIPSEALPHLGVKNAAQLATHLVKAGLWDEAPGGWNVHDYLEHNRSSADVAEIRKDRRASGARGGAASGHARRRRDDQPLKQNEGVCFDTPEANTKQVSKPTVAVADNAAVAVAVLEGGPGETAPMDVWFDRLKSQYPKHRITSGHTTMTAFCDALFSAKDGVAQAFTRMLANLENQKRGHEWRVKGMAPGLEKWLTSGAWEQQHDEAAPVADQLTAKTNRTMAAAADVLRGRP
jgi:hypothetical protein